MMFASGHGFVELVLVVLIINTALAFAVGAYARSKGFPFAPVLVAAIFVSVPLTWLIVAVMPPRTDSRL